jgi:hypothetical protein
MFESIVLVRTRTHAAIEEHSIRSATEQVVIINDVINDVGYRTFGLSNTAFTLEKNCEGSLGKESGSTIISSDGLDELIITSAKGTM